MSFYSDLIESITFSGGSHVGDGRYLGGMITGSTYGAGVLNLQRIYDPTISVTLGLGSQTGVTASVFNWFTGNTYAQLNGLITGVTPNDVFLMSSYTQNIYMSLKPTGVIAGTYGDSNNVPVLGFNDKGYVTGATQVALSTLNPTDDAHGAYNPNNYYILPRTSDTTTVNVSAVASSNRYTCYPFHLTHTQTLVEMGMIVMALAGGQNIKLGIYNQRDYVLKTLVKNYGTIDTSALTGYRGLLANTPLSADTYFACMLGSTVSPVVSSIETSKTWGTIPAGTSISNPVIGYGLTLTTANSTTLPNIFTGTTTVLTNTTTPIAIFLRFTGGTVN